CRRGRGEGLTMAILADANSRILVQGVTNPLARFQCEEMLRHGSKLLGVVARPDEVRSWSMPAVPVFQTTQAAVTASSATLIMIFSPPLEVKAAVSEAISAGVPVIVCLSDRVP